jgi:DNA-binding IclR family transcriptional regulator
MACIGSSGELTDSARRILAALDPPSAPEQVAALTELPLFRVRSGLRELAEAGLVESSEGAYKLTERVSAMLQQAG